MREAGIVTISMMPKFKKKLDDAAKKLDVPRSVLIRKAISDYLKSKPLKADFKKDY